MAKSAFVEVNITNPTRLAQDSQDTANNAVKGVTDLNDPNLMSVIEKQNNIGQFAGLTSQYNVLVQSAKDDGIDTTAVTTAYNNLNRFMADILADPDHASDVDRVTYKKYQDAYNQELVNLQSALQNNVNNKFTSAANATSQASSTASQAFSAANGAFSQAQVIGSQADSAIAVQSQATAKAQSTADNAFSQAQVIGSQASAEIATQSEATLKAQNIADSAFKQAQSANDYTDKQIASQASAVSEVSKNASEASSQANSALDAANSANAEITNLKGGSTLTIAKLEDGLGTKVDNSDFSTYKTQTASQFAETVKEADFKTYQTQTSKLIEAKVDNGTYQSDKIQTAKDISSKVSSSDFNTYKTQTADLIDDKVSSSQYSSDKTQTASEIADRVSNSAFSTYQTQTASQIASKVDNGDFSTYKTQTADLIASKVATKDFSAYQATTAKAISSKVESGDFNTYKTQTAGLIGSKVDSGDFSTYKTQTDKLIEAKVDNGTYQSDKTQTANDIASKVANKDFETYKSQTADLISSKVATKDFNTYTSQTATAINSKVESSDFNTYKTQTDSAINDKVSSAKYASDKTQTDNAILSKVSKKDANNVNLIPYSSNFSDSLEGWQLMDWGATDRKLLVMTHSFYQNGTGKLLYLNTAQNATSAAGSLRFSVLPNTKYTFQFKAFASSNVVGANVYFLSRAYGSTKDYDTVHGLFNNLVTSPSHIDQYTVTFMTGANDNEGYIRVDNIGSNNSASSGLFFTELKMEPGDTATPYVYGGQDSMISQMAGDINLRVTKDGLLDQINLQAGKTLISSSGQLTLSGKNIYFDSANPVIIPSANIDKLLVGKKLTAADISANTFTTNNGTFTVYQDGSITAKNMTLTGGTLTSPTINTSKINSATINGTTINAGDINNNGNNTARFYPLTIDSSGSIRSYHIDSYFASSAKLYTGNLIISNRNMNANAGSNKFGGETAVLGGSSLTLSSGYTEGKDTDFTKPLVSEDQPGTTKLILSGITGITLKGDDQKIHFHGMYSDKQPKGITFTPYGNINGDEGSTTGNWYVGYNLANMTAQFGIDNLKKNTIELYRPTFVDEIGALGGLSNGRLLLHAVDGNAQMYLLNDGSPAVSSPTVYNRTYSNGANVYVTSYGRIGRATSASKYKLAIARSDDTLQADRLMTLKPASWNDKVATEKMAESLSNGEIPVEEEINLRRHYGLIAEDLRDAGLDEFLITGKDGQIEGIEYDRLWTVLIPKIKQLNNRINELERKTL